MSDIFDVLGLSHNPFSCTAATTNYFYTSTTKAILEELSYGIQKRKGFMVLLGEVGVGKTSLLYQLLKILEDKKLSTSWLFNTMLDRRDLLFAIARDFEIPVDGELSVGELLNHLHHFFLEQYKKEYNCAIIIDEAHNLDPSTLEVLRMLSNLEAEGVKLVQILLVGQPELKEKLDQPNLRQLRSRINIFLTLPPLTKEEVIKYVNFKLASANGEIDIDSRALNLLWKATQGNMRMVNLVMERCLYAMVAEAQQKLTHGVMKTAVNEVASYQTDISRNLKKSQKLINILSMTVLFLVTGILSFKLFFIFSENLSKMNLFSLNFSTERQTTKPKTPTKNLQKTLLNKKKQKILATNIKDKVLKKNKNPKKNKIIIKEVDNFLHPFGLEYLKKDFEQAVLKKEITLFKEKLPHGIDMLELNRLPWMGDLVYSVFPWEKYVNKKPRWLVLWKPPFVITEFYPSYKNENIARLQQMLNFLGFYMGKIDGRVGPITWKAIGNFQKTYGLKRTGIPDSKTVFWIYTIYLHKKKTK